MPQRVVTVRGDVAPGDIGRTLVHEHLLWDASMWAHALPQELGERERCLQPVRLENRGHVVYHNFFYPDNLLQKDVDVAVDECRRFRLAGGSAICDVSNIGIGRDPDALWRISSQTGVHVVMGAGRYVHTSWDPDDLDLGEGDITRQIVEEFTSGVGPRHIRPGILGEIGVSSMSHPVEVKNLRASGAAQRVLGCPLLVHTPIWEKEGHRILDVLAEAGADLGKVALSHLDPTMEDRDYADTLARRGAYIVFDQFGMELMTHEGIFLPSDGMRVRTIVEQVRRGNLHKILLSHDVAFKICLTRWGGFGYAHILENIVPRLLQNGVTQEQIDIITIENPRRLLGW